MIKTDFDIVDCVKDVINVAQVSSLVSAIRPVENLPADYTSKTKFIVISLLSGDAEDMQQGFININVYVPDIVNVPDYYSLRTITNAIVPLFDDCYINQMTCELNTTPKTFKDQDIDGYHFTNIKIKFYNPSINLN